MSNRPSMHSQHLEPSSLETANRFQHLDFSTSVFPSLTKHNPSYPPFSTGQIALPYQSPAFLISNYHQPPASTKSPPRSVISQSSSAHDPRCNAARSLFRGGNSVQRFCSRGRRTEHILFFFSATNPLSLSPSDKTPVINAQASIRGVWLMRPIEYRD